MEQVKIAPLAKKQSKKGSATDTPSEFIEERQTAELVIGMCGPIGSGVSTVCGVVSSTLEKYGYTVKPIKVSNLIEKNGILDQTVDPDTSSSRYGLLQDAGNILREEHGNDILVQLAIQEISTQRQQDKGSAVEPEQGVEIENDEALLKREKRRFVTIIDSLKHPGEVALLQQVYGNMFYLFGVLCTDTHRKSRLKDNKGLSEEEAVRVMEKDKSDDVSHGQQLLKTLKHADFFVRNNKPNINTVEAPIDRFVSLLLGKNDISPTVNEYGMYIAEAAAKMSGCISKQVGAAILTKEGDIVSTGRNDVPKSGGGLYTSDDQDGDNRCFNYFNKSCFNSKYKKIMLGNMGDIVKEVLANSYESNGKNFSSVKTIADRIIEGIAKNSKVKDLLEFSRAVHAEMDAITSAARNGNTSLRNTVLYSTTFPCHHCARHIVAAGINMVYYIEPYEKSLALELHNDSILLEPENDCTSDNKVIFLHFEGVAPKQYLKLFSREERKKDGRLNEPDLHASKPIIATFLDTHIEYESKVVKHVQELKFRKKEVGDE